LKSELKNNEILTAELVALVERMEPDPGPEPGTTEHTDAEFDAMDASTAQPGVQSRRE
jgi:hypothetical protein